MSPPPQKKKKNLPYGLALRIHSIVSDPDVRDGRFAELTAFLRSRGHPTTPIRQQLEAVQTHPPPGSPTNPQTGLRCRQGAPCLHVESTTAPLSHLVDRSFPIAQASVWLREVFERPLVSYPPASEPRDLLVRTRSKPANSGETAGTFPCNAAGAKPAR